MCPPSLTKTPSFTSIPKASSVTTCPFDIASLEGRVNPEASTFVELQSNSKVYPFVCSYVAEHARAQDKQSFGLNIGKQTQSPLEKIKAKAISQTSLTLGLGLFEFNWKNEKTGEEHQLHALHQRIGDPVGSDCGVQVFTTLVLFANGLGKENVVRGFCEELLSKSEQTKGGTFTMFRWHMRFQYWKRDCTVLARPVDSVVLPQATRDKVVNDVDEFLSEESFNFYLKHGIPYRRSYLFFGVPGAGKTSLIQALAGQYERNLCFLQPTHPDMTDDSLRSAVQEAPDRSIIVFEDIDALFEGRDKKIQQSPLTFSGLLNALDGVGNNTSGQIFILTTNKREALDPALIRNGRVDLHVEFSPATEEQMRLMYAAFYPTAATELVDRFAKALQETLKGREVNMAAMQHFFISQRKCSAEEVINNVAQVVADLDEKQTQADAKKEEEDQKAAAAADKKETSDSKKAKAKAKAKATRGTVHVHIHNHSNDEAGENEEEEE